MKKTIFAITVLALVFASSCKKSSNPGGSWTFKGTTYTTTTSIGSANTLTVSNASTSNLTSFGEVVLYFNGSALPTTGGSFTVVNGSPASSTQVSIMASTGGGTATYGSTGNGSNQTVTVSVSGGKVSVSGSGIELVNSTTPSDSSALTLNVTQLQ